MALTRHGEFSPNGSALGRGLPPCLRLVVLRWVAIAFTWTLVAMWGPSVACFQCENPLAPLQLYIYIYIYIYIRRTYFQTVWQKLCQNGVSGWGSFEENSCCICMFLLSVFWLDATFRSSNAALKHPFSEVNYQPHCSPKAWNHDE